MEEAGKREAQLAEEIQGLANVLCEREVEISDLVLEQEEMRGKRKK